MGQSSKPRLGLLEHQGWSTRQVELSQGCLEVSSGGRAGKKNLVLAQCCAKEQLLGIGFGAFCFRASRTWPGVVLAVFSHKMRAVIPSQEGSFITFLTSPAGWIWPGGERRGIFARQVQKRSCCCNPCCFCNPAGGLP